MDIYLLRHGTTEWNAGHRIQGGSDTLLDPLGKKIAQETGTALEKEGIRFDRVYSSPLQRARETADLVCPGGEILTDDRLRELHFGSLEGRTVREMTGDPTCPFRYFKIDPARYDFEVRLLTLSSPDKDAAASEDIPETLTALRQRAEKFIAEVIEPLVKEEAASKKRFRLFRKKRSDKDLSILISGHGAVNRALLMAFQKQTDLRSFWGKGLQENCGITLIRSSIDKDGNITFSTDDVSRTYYDPALKDQIPNLL